MSSLIDIQSQIEKLQKQAHDIKVKEFDKTILEIVEKMRAFGITVKDLQTASSRKASSGSGKKRKGAAPVKTKKAAASVPAKYRGPSGESWSGRGITPRWLAALIAEGKSKEDFAIKA